MASSTLLLSRFRWLWAGLALLFAALFSPLQAATPTPAISKKASFIQALEAGRPQTIVTYGTSLTAGGAWVAQLKQTLDRHFPKLTTVTNSGQGGMWSKWGVENLEARVIAKKPDAVFIEFAINDAFLKYEMTPALARQNLETMIDRILAAESKCEIILMVMNPPTAEHLERRPKIADYEQVYRDVAQARGLRFIDHSAHWQAVLKKGDAAWRALVPDGIHPSAKGSAEVTTPHLLRSIGLQP